MKKISTRLFCLLILTGFIAACGEESDTDGKKKGGNVNVDGDYAEADDYLAKVIYGEDNRLDLYQIQDRRLLGLADSTVALISTSDLTAEGSVTRIRTTKFADSYRLPLCQTERFREQDTAAFCSGFLVAPNMVATAGHCIRSEGSNTSDCATTRFVFGFNLRSSGYRPLSVPTGEVYSCKRIVKHVLTSSGADYSLIELDRAVSNHRPLKIRRAGVPSVNDDLVVIGHPSGLPTKVADGAKVRSIRSSYLQASLDTYGGNSGSAVFNTATLEVEGILVRGEEDFVTKNGCLESKRCEQNACRGEDVTRVSEFASYVPQLVTDEPGGPGPGQPGDGSGGAQPGGPGTPGDTTQPNDPTQPRPLPSITYRAAPRLHIPDNNRQGAETILTVNQTPQGRKIKVEVSITHPWRGDLVVTLVAPDGRSVVLVNRKGRSADNIIGTFGANLMSEGPLNLLSDVPTPGIWKLIVQDMAAYDVGLINHWALTFE